MATEHGMNYGTQVVFTYGPLGFLSFPTAALWSATIIESRLHELNDPGELVAIAPRANPGADLERLEREGERIRDVFVEAVMDAAETTAAAGATSRMRERETS